MGELEYTNEQDEKAVEEKRVYVSPTIVEYGSVSDLTGANVSGITLDHTWEWTCN